jgi:ABC-2 type transport system ATP-binding protein
VSSVVLAQVHARDAAGPNGRARGAITALTLALEPGLHTFLGAPEDGALALFDTLSGARPPLKGKITVAGHAPFSTASVRARLGALGPEPRLPPAPTVGGAIRLALAARGERELHVDAVLAPLGLAALHARRPGSLSFAEARAVELALALTTPAPLLIVLHEPLADVAVAQLAAVPRRLRELAAAGACVVAITSSPADARALEGRILVLHRGFLVREAGGGGAGLALDEAEITAWVRDVPGEPGVRELAAALTRRPGIHRVTWDDGARAGAPVRALDSESLAGAGPSRAGRAGPALVRVRGDSAEACAEALLDAAVESAVTLDAIAPTSPDLAAVRAATDTLLRMRASAPRASIALTSTPLPAPVITLSPAREPTPPAPLVAIDADEESSPEPEPERALPEATADAAERDEKRDESPHE